jgi:hypothetical protein
MLSLLPPELLRQIIESTVTHTFHSTTYQERQDTLCSLSLVSKQFYAIAQPLLFEIVWVRSLEEIELLFSCGGGSDRRKLVRCAIVEIDEEPDESSEDIQCFLGGSFVTQFLLQRFSAVKMLTLVNDSDMLVDLTFLSSFKSTLLPL